MTLLQVTGRPIWQAQKWERLPQYAVGLENSSISLAAMVVIANHEKIICFGFERVYDKRKSFNLVSKKLQLLFIHGALILQCRVHSLQLVGLLGLESSVYDLFFQFSLVIFAPHSMKSRSKEMVQEDVYSTRPYLTQLNNQNFTSLGSACAPGRQLYWIQPKQSSRNELVLVFHVLLIPTTTCCHSHNPTTIPHLFTTSPVYQIHSERIQVSKIT